MFEAVDLSDLPAGAIKWAERVNDRLSSTSVRLVTYQLVAVCMMLFRALGEPDDVHVPAGGTVLGDEAGLGKTVQGIVFAAMLQSELLRRGHLLHPVLIVVPSNGVLQQWIEWMRIFFNNDIAVLSGTKRHALDHTGIRAFIVTSSTMAHDFTNRSDFYLNPHTKMVQKKPWPDQSDIDAVYESRLFKTAEARDAMAERLRNLAKDRKTAQDQLSIIYRRALEFITIVDEAHMVGCELTPHKSSEFLADCKVDKISWWAVLKTRSIVTCPMTATPMQNTSSSVLGALAMANPTMSIRLPMTKEMMSAVIRRSSGRVAQQLLAAGRCPPAVAFVNHDEPCDNVLHLKMLDDIDREIASAQAASSVDGRSTFALFAAIQKATQASLLFSIFDSSTGKLAKEVAALENGRPNFTNIEQKINRTLYRHFKNISAPPAIIACAYVEGCERLKRVIEATNQLHLWPNDRQLRVHIYSGNLSAKERARVLEQFGALEVDVLIMTPQSGGTGLNLAAASLMIVVGCGWNAAAEHQMRQRIVRYGSPHKSVTIVRVSLAHSIPSWMAKVAADKQLIAQDLLGGEANEPVYGGDECFHPSATRNSFKAMARQLVGNLKTLSLERHKTFRAKELAAVSVTAAEPEAKRQRVN